MRTDAAFGAKAVTRSTSPSMKFKLPVVYPMAFVSITRTRVVEPGPTALPGPPGVVGANWKPTVPPEAERSTEIGAAVPGPNASRPPVPGPAYPTSVRKPANVPARGPIVIRPMASGIPGLTSFLTWYTKVRQVGHKPPR